ncbi:Chromatin modification- protein meaf6 [Coemansia biformis]|uniref:Chromatin modification-related protein EAF6 n=1 Tax=Coemansia biformis TaxID=1286918 RepID=A0A9W7YDL6_9FUNG|nr:Chromatin modification- protein meaf6 [Coemansia biformis]
METLGDPAQAAPVKGDETPDNAAGGSKEKGLAANGSGGKAGSKPGKGEGPKEGKITKKMVKEAEQELFQLLLKKKQADRNLIDTETAIYDFETSYFESSGQEGNIVHGYDGYLNTGRSERRQQQHLAEADRIFSQSSATFKKAQEAKIAASLLDSDTDDSDSGARTKGRKGATIRHGSGVRQGTPTPSSRTAKKIRLSIDGSM